MGRFKMICRLWRWLKSERACNYIDHDNMYRHLDADEALDDMMQAYPSVFKLLNIEEIRKLDYDDKRLNKMIVRIKRAITESTK
jgi:hypothetical protein